MIEFDVETTGLQWYAHDLFMVQFLGTNDEHATVLRHPEDREMIQVWLDGIANFRAWNSKFDLHFLEAAGYRLPKPERWHDGMLIAHILDERKAVALQAVGDRIFGDDAKAHTEVAVKEWLKQETAARRSAAKHTGSELVRPNYSDVPDEIMVPYAAHDVELQRNICGVLKPRLTGDLRDLYELERETMVALYDAEKLGLCIDTDAAERFEHQLESDFDRIEDEAKKLAGSADFNPGSSAQIGEALKRRGADLSFARVLENGMPSTEKESLQAIDDQLASKVLEFRSASKMYKTNVYPMLHPVEDKTYGWRAPYITNGRLHTNFRQVGARTGRMSSSDPNVQNWHRDDLRLRHLITASPGNKLVACDLDSIELRLFAAFVGGGKLLELMSSEDADLHTYTAKMIGLKDLDRGGGVMESARQRGKKFNYTVIYGGGIRTIRRSFFVNQNEAKNYLFKYHEAFPEVGEFQSVIERTLEDKGYVRTPWGRRHRAYSQKTAAREAYKFVNLLVQGCAADLFKESIVRVHKLGIPMVTFTHDEILADVPKADAAEAAHEISIALTDHPRITDLIPLGADAKIVDRWSYAKNPDFVPDYEGAR